MFRKRNNYNDKRAPKNFTEIEPVKDASMPVDSRVGRNSALLGGKSLKGLPRVGSSLTVKADPYALTLPDSDPYALVNGLNAKAGGKYGGKDNLGGGVVEQLSSSEVSSFLHAFDSMLLRCRVNYRYLPITSTDVKRGKGFVREMIQAIDEIISIAKSTTYTQLAVNQYYIKTDLPVYDPATGSFESNINKERSCGSSDGLYALLIGYQCYLQSFAQVFNAYNKFRANQGVMKSVSWNRETPRLNSYFTLMNKNSMVGQFKSLAYVLNGEYFDTTWMRQFNMIGSLISRKSNSIMDPIKEVTCTHNLPKFTLYIKTKSADVEGTVTEVVVFDTKQFDELVANSLNPFVSGLETYEAALDYFSYRLSVNDTLYYVRNDTIYAANTDQSRFSAISDFVGILINAAGLFKPAMGDLRTMLDVIQRVGANAWSKSTVLEIFNVLDSNIMQNLTVDDLYQSLMSGADEVQWDADTYRWRYYTIWDYYYSIPEYDAKSGGSFLTFSTKKMTAPQGYPAAGDYMPVFISGFITKSGDANRDGAIYALNRLGSSYTLDYVVFDPSINPTSARLVPLTNASFNLRIPRLSGQTPETLDLSFLQAACLKAFGSFYNGTGVVTATSDLTVNPDQLCLIPIEIEDLTNEMITYARTEGPFRVNLDKVSEIGFLGLA